MVPVQLRDADNPDRFLIDYIELPFEPRPGVPLYVWDDFDTRRTGFLFGSKKKERCFVITEVLRYELSLKEPGKSGIVFLGREVKP